MPKRCLLSCDVFLLPLLFCLFVANTTAQSGSENGTLAAMPPMGWNSWDGYGTTITETDFKANAKWLADHLKDYGWQYAVIDMEWFVINPTPEGNSKNSQYTFDTNG